VLGLGGKGKRSPVPEFGGENAESGRLGLMPFLREPTPGEGGVGGMVAMKEEVKECHNAKPERL
jgi:hypothetical protein